MTLRFATGESPLAGFQGLKGAFRFVFAVVTTVLHDIRHEVGGQFDRCGWIHGLSRNRLRNFGGPPLGTAIYYVGPDGVKASTRRRCNLPPSDVTPSDSPRLIPGMFADRSRIRACGSDLMYPIPIGTGRSIHDALPSDRRLRYE